jgi:hypothetical protein
MADHETEAVAGAGAVGDVPGPSQNQSFQIYPFFTGTDKACTNAVYLLPPSFKYAAGFPDGPITIPLLYARQSDALPPGIAPNPDFALAFTSTAKAPFTQANVSVQITIAPANIWACAAKTRQTLMQNFTAFLVAVEALETAGTLVPGAARIVGSQIADTMPAPLAETLFWRYSLSPGLYPGTIPYVDIRPGMRLRVDGAISQFVDPGAPQNGYVAGSRLTFPVGSTGSGAAGSPRVLSFDALLGGINSPHIAARKRGSAQHTATPVATAVAAGAADLEPAGGTRPYWRLIYPPAIPSPFDAGDTSITDNVVLLGAPTIAALEAATQKYPALDPGGATPNLYLAFLGRALPVPEIPVFTTFGSSGPRQLEWVSVGTTLANLIERFFALPLDPGSNVFGGLKRPISGPPPSTVSCGLTVKDPGGTTLTALPPGIFDLPLIAGDGVTLTV